MASLAERLRCFLPVVKAVAQADVEILEIGLAGASAIIGMGIKEARVEGHVTCVDAWLPYCDLEKEKSGRTSITTADDTRRGDRHDLQAVQHNVSASGFGETIVSKIGKSCEICATRSKNFHVVYVDASHLLEDVLLSGRSQTVGPARWNHCGDDLRCSFRTWSLRKWRKLPQRTSIRPSRSGVPTIPE